MTDEAAYLRFLEQQLPLRPLHHVFDIGGASGAYTDLVHAQWTATTRCHIFEPRPGTLERFAANPNVLVNQVAVADFEGPCDTFVVAQDHVEQSHMRAAFSGDVTLNVAVTTVDAYMAAADVDYCTLLKIDTEGYEPQVLRGARESIAARQIWAIQFEYGGTWGQGPSLSSVTDELQAAGYELFEWSGTVSPLISIPEDLQYRNLLAVAT